MVFSIGKTIYLISWFKVRVFKYTWSNKGHGWADRDREVCWVPAGHFFEHALIKAKVMLYEAELLRKNKGNKKCPCGEYI